MGTIAEISLVAEHSTLAQEALESLKQEIQAKTEAVDVLEMKVRGATQRHEAEKSQIRQELLRIKINDYESERRRMFNEELRTLESDMLVKDKEFQSFYNDVRRRQMDEEVCALNYCHDT